MGKLLLVGAGPGDPELITLKAIKALEMADVVLYDALANDELLSYCRKGCHKVYVGKKAGLHAYQQIFINDMMVDYVRQNKIVVRLKGGDPFVFGRGHEELAYAWERGIDVEVVPGVSSALAVPTAHHIPLTKRGVNESFWVVTGTTMNGSFSNNLAFAARSTATVVILMGMKNLSKIISLFQTHRGNEESIAIIQNGTRHNEKAVIGTLKCVEQKTLENEMSNPAIIIIGEVVKSCLSSPCLEKQLNSIYSDLMVKV